MPVFLISACLLGSPCRYDGTTKPLPEETIRALTAVAHLVPICPEIMGGLPTPRIPAEIVGERVLRRDGVDVSAEYRRGAVEAVRLAELFHASVAICKEKSPSCGHGKVYDGTFSGTLTVGDGIAAGELAAHGIRVIGESEISALLQEFSRERGNR